MTLNKQQLEMCAGSKWDFSDDSAGCEAGFVPWRSTLVPATSFLQKS